MRVELNPDREFVKQVQAEIKHNNGYCPYLEEKSKDTRCMCKEFRDQVDRCEGGACYAGLYIASVTY